MVIVIRLLLIAGCVFLSAGLAAAQGVCSLQNVQGTYVNTVSIYSGTTPMVTLGLTNIDASGHWVGPGTIVTPGGPMPLVSEGEIEVNPDCTALIKQSAGGYDHIWAAVILRNGEEIRSLHIDPATEPMPAGRTVRAQTLLRLTSGPHEVANCSAARLAGRYGQSCTGWIRSGTGTYMPSGAIGAVTINGDGSSSGGGIMMSNGQEMQFSYDAFSVEPDCRGLASLELDGTAYSQRLVMFDQGKQIVSITLSADQVNICRFERMDK